MVGAVLLALGAAQTAKADSYTETAIGVDLQFGQLPQFDDQLGTLQGISYTANLYVTQSYYPNQALPPPSIPVDYSVDVEFPGTVFSEAGTVELPFAQGGYDTGVAEGSIISYSYAGDIPVALYDAMVAGGDFDARGGAEMAIDLPCQACFTWEGGPDVYLDVGLNFTYDAPEPSTILLIIAGLLGTASVRRRYGVTTLGNYILDVAGSDATQEPRQAGAPLTGT